MTSITIVTPWLNHRELERQYWEAVRTEDCEVVIVDDGSQPPLPNAWRLERSMGFHHACNTGLDLARTDAVLFLNNDVFARRAGWLESIREALEPGVLVGPVIRYDQHGNVDGHSLPYLDGWCLAGMRDDLMELGGFDEEYAEPSYYGDNDLSFRARLAGMTLREAGSGICHLASQTTGGATGPGVAKALEANHQRFCSLVRESLVAA